ncbi:hypothetical protein SeLEV6574_g04597 [Synchytrium endobioticum]|nr:hypothetical protein SeLEV6574_g04597 [Synchytrium endobioticum]
MSKYLIIVLLLLALLHHGFADPEDTDALLKQRSEALRGVRPMCQEVSKHQKQLGALHQKVFNRLQNSPNEDPAVLISLVVQYMVDVGFTKNHVEPPHAGMSQAELEFRWEALALANYLLPGGIPENYNLICLDLMNRYWNQMTFGSAGALEEEGNVHPDDMQDMMELDNTVEAASLHTGYPGAQEDIYNPGTTSRGADGESRLGMRSSAQFEGSSSSRSSLKRDASGEDPCATEKRQSRRPHLGGW